MGMVFQNCEELLRLVHIAQKLTPTIIRVILPEICELIVPSNPGMTAEEAQFYNICCNPIPTLTLNTTFESVKEANNSNLEKVCMFMSTQRKPDDEEFYNKFCSSWINTNTDPIFNILTYTLGSIIAPIGLLANLLILVTVYKVKRLRNTTGYFMCNLAVADLFVIFEMFLFHTFYRTGIMAKADERLQLYLFPSIDVMLGSASLLHVTAVSIERGIAVALPLRYPRYLSEHRARRVIQFIWLYCTFVFLLGISRIWITVTIYSHLVFYFAVTFSFLIPCLLVTTSYSVIMISALKNMKMEQNISKVIAAISLVDDNISKQNSLRPARFRELKITINVMTMTLPFVCGWGYFMICNTYELAKNYRFSGFENWLITFLPFFVSCMNPVTYIMFTRSLRRSSLLILTKGFFKVFPFNKGYQRGRFSTSTSTSNERRYLEMEQRLSARFINVDNENNIAEV